MQHNKKCLAKKIVIIKHPRVLPAECELYNIKVRILILGITGQKFEDNIIIASQSLALVYSSG